LANLNSIALAAGAGAAAEVAGAVDEGPGAAEVVAGLEVAGAGAGAAEVDGEGVALEQADSATRATNNTIDNTRAIFLFMAYTSLYD